MKTGRSLSDLAAEIERRRDLKRDYIVDTKALTPHAHHEGQEIHLVFGEHEVKLNEIAHQQIAQHTEIPKAYYEKMRAEAPELLASNIDVWFKKHPAKRMMRVLGDTGRAFLSDKFRPLENEDLAEAILPPMIDLGLDVMSSEITDRRLYIKAVDGKVTRELKALGGKFGDGKHNIVRMLAPAITISNSEVGMGALSVLAGVYDGFCSNLATFGERSVRKYHVGAKHALGDDTYAMLSDRTRRVTDEALWLQVGDIVRGAFARANFDSLCDKIAETTEQKIDGDPVKLITLSSKKFGMTEAEGKSVLRHLIEGADLTRFGFYNAVTRAAADLDDYDRASEFERMGGQIVELPRDEWKTLVAQAAA